MDTKQLSLEVSALIQRPFNQKKQPQIVRAVAWNEGESLEQAQQRHREKAERIADKLKANRERAAA